MYGFSIDFLLALHTSNFQIRDILGFVCCLTHTLLFVTQKEHVIVKYIYNMPFTYTIRVSYWHLHGLIDYIYLSFIYSFTVSLLICPNAWGAKSDMSSVDNAYRKPVGALNFWGFALTTGTVFFSLTSICHVVSVYVELKMRNATKRFLLVSAAWMVC